MSQLLWRRASDLAQIPAGACLRDGLSVHMEGRDYAAGATARTFSLLRVYSPLVRAYRRRRGQSPWRNVYDIYPAEPLGPSAARSESFPLKTSRFTGTHRWRFADDSGLSWVLSPEVRTSRFVDVRLPLYARTPAFIPVEAKIGVEVTIPTGLEDPALALSVILPWQTEGSEGRTVRDVLAEELTGADGKVEGDVLEGVITSARAFLPEEPQGGWEFDIARDTLELEPGASARTSVEIRLGELRKELRGVAFAVEAVDVDEPENRGVSDVVVVERDSKGEGLVVLYEGPDTG